METNDANDFSMKAKALCLDLRISSAFSCLYEQFQKGQISKAFDYFDNTIKSELEFARDDEIESYKKPTILLTYSEAKSE